MFMPSPNGMTFSATAAPIGNLAMMLATQVGRPVIDKTDLKGLYDFKLQFSPEGLPSPFAGGPFGGAVAGGFGPGGPGVAGGLGGQQVTTPSEPAPSLFTAIQELGFRLESTKGPVEVVVIESVQKPEEN